MHPGGRGSVPALAAGHWSALAPPPEGARSWSLAAWTGRYAIAWGRREAAPPTTALAGSGSSQLGAAFDPANDKWRRLPPAPVAFAVESTTWTGHAILAWGSASVRSDRPVHDVLLAFDPKAWRWERLSPPHVSPRTDAAVAWTGSEFVVFGGRGGGRGGSGKSLLSGASYNFATNRWSTLPALPRVRVPAGSTATPVGTAPVWAGRDLYVWITRQISVSSASTSKVFPTVQALRWRPGADHWQRVPLPPRGTDLYEATVLPTGSGFAILDGSGCLPMMSCVVRLTGKSVFFHPSSSRWSTVPGGAVLERAGSFVWTGRSLVALSPVLDDHGYVLGGYAAALDSEGPTWARLPQLPVPRVSPSGSVVSGALWAGSELLDSNLALVPEAGRAHGFAATTLTTASLSACPPIPFPDSIGTFCGPAPGPGDGHGPSGSCLGNETAPPCGPGMVADKYYSYTLTSTCANAYIDGRWWRNELPGGSGPIDVWMAVMPGKAGAGWISPAGAVGFRATASTGCSPTN
jgi:hypothetical protein